MNTPLSKVLDLSVVVVVWNCLPEIRACLQALSTATRNLQCEIIVVDNASKDETSDFLRKTYGESVQLIQNKENRGFAAACNQGLRASNSPYILLLNPDTLPNAHALKGMLEFLKSNPHAGAAGCALVYPDGSPQSCAFDFPNPWNVIYYYTALGALLKQGQRGLWRLLRTNGSPKDNPDPQRKDWLMGACLMVKRQMIEQVGFMDETFFLFFEDTDWCRRIHEHGWQIYWLPSLRLVHAHQHSHRQVKKHSMVLLFRNLRIYFERHNSGLSQLALRGIILLDMASRWLVLALWRRFTRDRQPLNRERQEAAGEILRMYWQRKPPEPGHGIEKDH